MKMEQDSIRPALSRIIKILRFFKSSNFQELKYEKELEEYNRMKTLKEFKAATTVSAEISEHLSKCYQAWYFIYKKATAK